MYRVALKFYDTEVQELLDADEDIGSRIANIAKIKAGSVSRGDKTESSKVNTKRISHVLETFMVALL